MPLVICFGLFLILASAITIYGYAHFVKPGQLLQQLKTSTQLVEPERPDDLERSTSSEGFSNLLVQVGRFLPSSPQENKVTGSELTAAGFAQPNAVYIYLGIKLLACAVLLVLALMFRASLTDSPVGRLAILFAASGIGYMGPGFVLDRLIKRRQEQIRLALPDALDLLGNLDRSRLRPG